MIQDTKSSEEEAAIRDTSPWKLAPRYVPYRSVDSLQSVFSRTRVREGVKLPRFVPYSIRHKMTTVLRTKQVPEDQVALLLGHRRPEYRTTRLYGEFDPGYLRDAADAIDEYMWELDRRTDRSLFATAKSKAVTGGRIVDISKHRRTV